MNLLWIVIDTLRADHLGCYGYFRDTSPTMDRLAGDGVLFRDFYASAIATGPGFTSLFTGRSALGHGFYLTPWNIPNAPLLDDDIPTLPELVQDAGQCATVALDNLINFRSHMKQFVRGFEFYINVTRSSQWTHHHVAGGEVNQRLIEWLEQYGGQPFFAFVHYWDPHTPYNQPEPYRFHFKHEKGNLGDLRVKRAPAGYDYVPGWGRVGDLFEGDEQHSIDLYDGEIRYVDHCLEEVMEALARLGLLSDTAVVLTSDHGEQLGQHDCYGHARIYEECVRVPLILWGPRFFPRGAVVEGFAQHADVAPTILDLLGVQVPRGMDGQSLLPRVRGEGAGPEFIVMEDGMERALRRGPWKLIQTKQGRAELYDLERDPCEVESLVEREADRSQAMGEELAAWVQARLAGRPDPMLEAGGTWTCFVGERDRG